tara:strand:+ start:3031 stop:3165 length:135 start_codon:yes stop_codon:yes gene_type:complete
MVYLILRAGFYRAIIPSLLSLFPEGDFKRLTGRAIDFDKALIGM